MKLGAGARSGAFVGESRRACREQGSGRKGNKKGRRGEKRNTKEEGKMGIRRGKGARLEEETKQVGDMMQDEGSDYLDADEQIEEGH